MYVYILSPSLHSCSFISAALNVVVHYLFSSTFGYLAIKLALRTDLGGIAFSHLEDNTP